MVAAESTNTAIINVTGSYDFNPYKSVLAARIAQIATTRIAQILGKEGAASRFARRKEWQG